MPYSKISNRVYMSKAIDYFALGVRELSKTAAKPGKTRTRVDESCKALILTEDILSSFLIPLHVSKNLNISKTKQDIEKLITSLRFVWKCCFDAFKIGSDWIFSLQGHFNNKEMTKVIHSVSQGYYRNL